MAHFYLPQSNSTFIANCQLSKDTMVMADNQTFAENKFYLTQFIKEKVASVSIKPTQEDDELIKRTLLHTVSLLPSILIGSFQMLRNGVKVSSNSDNFAHQLRKY